MKYNILACMMCLLLTGCESKEEELLEYTELTDQELAERDMRDYEDFCRTHRKQHPEFYERQQ